jgi:ATP-dependent helicase/DNAse subunit B
MNSIVDKLCHFKRYKEFYEQVGSQLSEMYQCQNVVKDWVELIREFNKNESNKKVIKVCAFFDKVLTHIEENRRFLKRLNDCLYKQKPIEQRDIWFDFIISSRRLTGVSRYLKKTVYEQEQPQALSVNSYLDL